MAAITYKFGVQSEITPLDSASADMTAKQAVEGVEALRKGGGLGYTADELGVNFVRELSRDVINATHGGLESMAWLRRVVQDELAGKHDKDGRPYGFTVQFHGREVKLVLDRPLPSIPAWNPPTQEGIQTFSLLSWTSKMGTPSFSLPAGAPSMGGACPGAEAGQTIVPPDTLNKAAADVRALIQAPVRLPQAICQHCYAEGGQYSTGQVQFAQVLRYAWTQQAVRDGSFVDTMDWAIKHANFHLPARERVELEDLDDEGNKKVREYKRGERDGKKYFRLHDSGDFFSSLYIAAWKLVADRNPDVTFWAPSRVWAQEGLRKAVNEINAPRGKGDPRNLVIRPSAYHVNEHPADLVVVDRLLKHRRDPSALGHGLGLGPGWAAGSTAFKDTEKPSQAVRLGEGNPYNFDCQAYTTDSDDVTCRDAMPPGGKADADRGCRACWKYGHEDEHGDAPGLIVNYTLH